MGLADAIGQAVNEVMVEGRYRTIVIPRAPLPEDRSAEPPPSTRRELEKAEREKQLAERSEAYKGKKDEYEKKEKLSFKEKAQAKLDSMSHKMDKMKTGATQNAYDKVAEKMDKDAEERFKKHFPELVTLEKLVYHDYYCTLINQVTKETIAHRNIEGYMLVTDKSLLFLSDQCKHDPKFKVELKDIVSVRRSVKLETIDIVPHCMPLPSDRVVPQGFLVYTRQGHVHRFYDFKPTVGTASGNLTVKAFGILDWAWREVVNPIPVPDYQYDVPGDASQHADPHALMQDIQLKGAALASNASAAAQNAAAAIDKAKADPKSAILQAKANFGK